MITDAIASPPKPHAVFDWGAEQVEPTVTGKRAPGVLVVDDEVWVRTLVNAVLRQEGFAVWQTADGYQALKAYRGHRENIDLVLLDVRMPSLDGPQTLAALQQINPRLRCCFMTGDPGRYTEEELLKRGAERIIYKPFRLDELADLLRQLVAKSNAALPNGAGCSPPSDSAGVFTTDWQVFDGPLRKESLPE